MCIYLLTCQPICIHSMLLGLFCSLILVKNWLKKFSIAEKKVIQFWIHCLHFQCIQWWNFYLPGLDAVQFQIPQCRIFSRSAGHQIFQNLKTFGEIVFIQTIQNGLKVGEKIRTLEDDTPASQAELYAHISQSSCLIFSPTLLLSIRLLYFSHIGHLIF